MKKFVLIFAFATVLILAIQNRSALLFPFVHDGMTQKEVTSLLGKRYSEGFLVKGVTGPAHQTWTYYYSFFGYAFGNLQVRFAGDDILKTKKAEQGA